MRIKLNFKKEDLTANFILGLNFFIIFSRILNINSNILYQLSTILRNLVFLPDNFGRTSQLAAQSSSKLVLPIYNCTQTCPSQLKNRKITYQKIQYLIPNENKLHEWGKGYADLVVYNYSDIRSPFYDNRNNKRSLNYLSLQDYNDIYDQLYLESIKEIDKFWEIQKKYCENGSECIFSVPEIKMLEDYSFRGGIPEIYHYTWFTCGVKFGMLNFLSIFSVLKFADQPDKVKIFIHTDCDDLFKGSDNIWFNKIMKIAGNNRLIIQKIYLIDSIWNNKVSLGKAVHISDVYRIFLLAKFGGIYLDNDMVLLKSHKKFLRNDENHKNHNLIIAEESAASLANGFMMASPSTLVNPNKILLKWLQEYKYYQNIMMGPYSVMKIWALSQKYPEEITIVKNQMVRPNWLEIDLLFGDKVLLWGEDDDNDFYNMHLNSRYIDKMMLKHYNHTIREFSDIDCLTNTFGEVARFILYGNKDIC